jgi:hypothetical protein
MQSFGFLMPAQAIQYSGECREISSHVRVIRAERGLANRHGLSRQRLGMREVSTSMLQAAQIVIQRRKCDVIGIEPPPSDAKRLKICAGTLEEISTVLANHAKRIEKPNPNLAVGSSALLRELQGLPHEPICILVAPGPPLAFASGSQQGSTNDEQQPDHDLCAQAGRIVIPNHPLINEVHQDRNEREHVGPPEGGAVDFNAHLSMRQIRPGQDIALGKKMAWAPGTGPSGGI